MSPSLPAFASQQDEWEIPLSELEKYRTIFQSLGPVGGKLSGEKVKPVLLNSGLHGTILGKIWDLSDVDRDGLLDSDEMCVALHLVYRSLENDPLPNVLPLKLVPPSKRLAVMGPPAARRTSVPVGWLPVLPPPYGSPRQGSRVRSSSVSQMDGFEVAGGYGSTKSAAAPTQFGSLAGSGFDAKFDSSSLGSSSFTTGGAAGGSVSRSLTTTPLPIVHHWPVDTHRYEGHFQMADTDFDGLVGGNDVKAIFLQTGLAQNYLAHIWSLVDLKKSGMLNLEQFSLAMHMIERKKELNEEPPPTLPLDLIPPSLRPPAAGMTDVATQNTPRSDTQSPSLPLAGGVGAAQPTPSSGNPQIDLVQSEIDSIQRERRDLDAALLQMEADMTAKQSEIKTLEIELGTLDGTVQQLDRQRAEATRRLTEFDSQRDALENTQKELESRLTEEESQLDTRRNEAEKSVQDSQSREEELNLKRAEFQSLRDEENRIKVELENGKVNLDSANQRYGNVERDIRSVETDRERLLSETATIKSQMSHMDELLKSGDLNSLLGEGKSVMEAVQNLSLNAATNGVAAASSSGVAKGAFGQQDPFQATDPFSTAGATEDPFQSASPPPFGEGGDPFAPTAAVSDPFAPSTASPKKGVPSRPPPPKNRPVTPTTTTDPFSSSAGSDPFAGNSAATDQQNFANFADFSKFS